MTIAEDERVIRTMWADYCRAILEMDVETLESQWDRDFAHLVFQPEEFERASRTWTEIARYWHDFPSIVDHFIEWSELETDVAVLGEAALLYSVVQSRCQLKAGQEIHAGEVRFTLGLRRGPAGWRFVHLHESRLLVV